MKWKMSKQERRAAVVALATGLLAVVLVLGPEIAGRLPYLELGEAAVPAGVAATVLAWTAWLHMEERLAIARRQSVPDVHIPATQDPDQWGGLFPESAHAGYQRCKKIAPDLLKLALAARSAVLGPRAVVDGPDLMVVGADDGALVSVSSDPRGGARSSDGWVVTAIDWAAVDHPEKKIGPGEPNLNRVESPVFVAIYLRMIGGMLVAGAILPLDLEYVGQTARHEWRADRELRSLDPAPRITVKLTPGGLAEITIYPKRQADEVAAMADRRARGRQMAAAAARLEEKVRAWVTISVTVIVTHSA